MIHHLKPERRTLHGQYAHDLTPALTIESGDTVIASTLDVVWGMGQHGEPGQPRPKFPRDDSPHDDGPALHGPIHVNGAAPGMTLAVHIEALRTGSWGWTWAGAGPFTQAWAAALGIEEGEYGLLRWDLDPDAARATSELGHSVAMRPFLGMLGVCPPGEGFIEAWSPRIYGGNTDCKELVAGTTLFLPIAVPGALVSFGDAHAAQGHGEVAGSAIECPMERVELRFELIDRPTRQLRARTPTGRVTFGFGVDLDSAAVQAMRDMLDWMVDLYGLDRPTTLALASPVVDLHITQNVNGVCGVHAVLAEDAIEIARREG